MSSPEDIMQCAWLFASRKHNGQLYPGSEQLPYITHLGAVLLETLQALRANNDFDATTAVCCAILHDTVEDTETTIHEITSAFGMKVADGVAALTKNKHLQGIEATRDSLLRIREQPKEIWIVKLADRAANLLNPPSHWSLEKRSAYAQEGELILKTLGTASPHLAAVLSARIQAWKDSLQAVARGAHE